MHQHPIWLDRQQKSSSRDAVLRLRQRRKLEGLDERFDGHPQLAQRQQPPHAVPHPRAEGQVNAPLLRGTSPVVRQKLRVKPLRGHELVRPVPVPPVAVHEEQDDVQLHPGGDAVAPQPVAGPSRRRPSERRRGVQVQRLLDDGVQEQGRPERVVGTRSSVFLVLIPTYALIQDSVYSTKLVVSIKYSSP